MAEKKTDIKKAILWRVRGLYLAFLILGFTIAGKILYLQYGPNGDELRKKAEKVSYQRVDIEADRGDILSWDGRILATSVPMYEIRMDFAAQGLSDEVFKNNVDSLAYRLSSFFGDKSQSGYKNMLQKAFSNREKNRYTQISPRRINHIEIKDIYTFPIFRLGQNKGGLIVEQINRRLLPNGSLAARTIGRVNQSGTKLGIEGSYDSILRGVNGNVLMQRISGSFRVPVSDELSVDPIDGIDVVTTLDVDIQDVAETALRSQLEIYEADWGAAVLMEVATGEIRAMTNLTRKSNGQIVEDYNYAVGMNLEPGSTFKLASLIALLEDGGASMDEVFDTRGGTVYIGKARVTDDHDYGILTLKGIFEKSSNIGFAKAVNKYYAADPKKFVDFLAKMGMTNSLDLQINGEKMPLIRKPGDRWWDGTTLTNMAYGYALELSPLKTLSLYNAVANNGKMLSPLMVKELRQYGQTLRTFQSTTIVPAIASPKVIALAQEAMKGVVDEGTARFVLSNPYYTVAAKTGTAQIAQPGVGYTDRYGGRHYLATMVGYFPIEKPKYSCIVVVKTYFGNGRYKTYYGASLAGPVFRAIADRVYAQNTAWQVPVSDKKSKKTSTPPVKLGLMKEVKNVSSKFDIPYINTGNKTLWQNIVIASTDSSCLKVDSTVLPSTTVIDITPASGVVPTVLGLGLKEAIYLLESEGLIVSFSGVGRVESQSIKAGSKANRGEIIYLKLKGNK